MVVRTFEYGFRKGKENSNRIENGIRKLYFPKQKVIFFEENKNIDDQLKLLIIFSEEEEFLYKVDVIKYWQYSDEDLIQKQMYPLIPLQLFNLRKKLHFAENKNDIDKKGEKIGYEKSQSKIVLNMYLKGLKEDEISDITSISVEEVKEIIKKHIN